MSQYVNFGNDASLQLTNNFTVSAWVKAPAQGDRGVVTKHDGVSANQKSWFMNSHHTNTDKLYVNLSADGSTNGKQYVSSVTVFNDKWHHVAFTFGSNVLKIYVDGVEDTAVTKTIDNTVNALFNSTAAVLAGAYLGDGSPAGFLTGLVDEVSIWDKILDSVEIAEVTNNGMPGDLANHSAAANLVSYWHMGDGDTHPTIQDQIGSNDGTMVNMSGANFVSDIPPTFNLKAAQLDGVDERGRVLGNPPSLRITNNLTVSLWVKYPSPPGGFSVLTKWQSSGGASWLIQTSNQPGGPSNPLVLLSDNGSSVRKQYVGSIPIFNSNWNHFAFTFATNVLKFYVNGVEDTAINKQNDSTCNALFDSTTDILAGAFFNSSGTPVAHAAALLDEISIWNAELNGAQISEIYNLGIPKNLLTHSLNANLVSYWRMGDKIVAFPAVPDQKGSNTMTLQNMEAGDITNDAA